MLRRVRKEEVKIDPYTKPDGFDQCIACWKDWLAADADRDLGARTMAGLVGDSDGYGSCMTVYDAQQKADFEIGAATDVMIDSLKLIHVWAIYKMSSVANPWRFPNADILVVGPLAREALIQKLRNNCCTGRLF